MRGRGVPRERLLEVAEHYRHFGGVSPINEQNRALLAAIRARAGRPAGLLGQPQLAPAGRGHGRDHARRRGAAGAGVRHLGLHVVLGLPAVPGRPGPGPGRGRGRARRSCTSCGTTSTTRASSSRPRTRSRAALVAPARTPGWSSPRTRSRCDGGASGPGGHSTRRSCGRRPGWSPRRSAGRAPTSTWSGSPAPGRRRCRGWSRTSTTTWRRWRRPARPRSWSRRSASCPTTSRCSGTWTRRRRRPRQARAGLRPGGDGRHRPAVRPDGPPAGRGADRRRAELALGPMGPSHDVCPLDCCPAPRRRPADRSRALRAARACGVRGGARPLVPRSVQPGSGRRRHVALLRAVPLRPPAAWCQRCREGTAL